MLLPKARQHCRGQAGLAEPVPVSPASLAWQALGGGLAGAVWDLLPCRCREQGLSQRQPQDPRTPERRQPGE